ncbi:Cytochrome c-type biogenesis protein CcdA (DsbD analog) [hydrothermal vent metagenome]|uniref:Cytochrome c-type biogenesis protein CcdA (DsbD analog) n=1 Tax=hydrothermal vent metagenome TaxID=652676 RepID=A0A3B1BKH8_9ZZZZ
MSELLLITAALLGLLAFYEPCTIATHTLFSVRVHRQSGARRFVPVFLLWLIRSTFLATLLALAVFLTTPFIWNAYFPSLMLALIATIYVVSRVVYLPVPHFELYRLWPQADAIPEPVRLGLTLPACTLPLFLIITGISIQVDSMLFAILAGLLFSSLFTLPVMISSCRGIQEKDRHLLAQLAKGTPFFTAGLLYVSALLLLLPGFDLSESVLTQSLEQASLTGLGLGFLAGFVFSFNPVSFASIPVMLAYVTKAHEPKRALLLGAAFVVGMLVTHVLLGVTAAWGGEWVKAAMGRQWGLVLGPILIFLGLIWPGWITFRLPWISARAWQVSSVGGAFLLAIPFSVAVCPFCTPALLVLLTASASIGSPSFGFLLLFAFALGRSIPVILGAWSMGWLESLSFMQHHQKMFEIIAGTILILSGLYLINEYFLFINIWM